MLAREHINLMWSYDAVSDVFWYDNKWFEKDDCWYSDPNRMFAPVPESCMEAIRAFRASGQYTPYYKPKNCGECKFKNRKECGLLSVYGKKKLCSRVSTRKDCPLKEEK